MSPIDIKEVIKTRECIISYKIMSATYEDKEQLQKAIALVSGMDKYTFSIDGLTVETSMKFDIAQLIPESTWEYFSEPCRDIFDEAKWTIGQEILIAQLDSAHRSTAVYLNGLAKKNVEDKA